MSNLNEEEITCAVFFDLSNAFGTSDHNILIKKLAKYGVSGLLLLLFETYLTDRQQYTVVNGVKSQQESITCGVPQGSILGPLFSNIYINDLPLIYNHRISMFADDTSMIISHKDGKCIQNIANKELDCKHRWMLENKLTLNCNKTEYIIVSN